MTDIVSLANENKIPVKAVKLDSKEEVLGANNLEELNQLERNYQLLKAKEFLKKESSSLIQPEWILEARSKFKKAVVSISTACLKEKLK